MKPIKKYDPEIQPLHVAIDGRLFVESPYGRFGWISKKPGGPDSSGGGFDPWKIYPGAREPEDADPNEPLRTYARVRDSAALDRVIDRGREILETLAALQKGGSRNA